MKDIPKIARARLQRSAAVQVGTHPDADLITAFSEQCLPDREREIMMQHLVHCGDCREIVALALPAAEIITVAGSHASRTNWLSWPGLRWGVVAAGILAVTSVGVLQLRQRHEEKASAVLMARNQLDQPVIGPAAPLRESPPQTANPAMDSAAVSKSLPRRNSNSMSSDKTTRSSDATFAQPTRPRFTMRQKRTVSSPLTAPSSDTSSTAGNATPENAGDEPRVGKAKALPQPLSAMAPAPELRADPGLMKGAALPQWVINSSGVLQRSLDGGKSWADVNLAAENSQISPATVFHALTVSSSASEVWAGGTKGALYHTLNAGNLWVRVVPSAAGVPLTGDIVSIQFSDARTGTITTSNAEVWTTNDSGQTWSKRE